MHIRRLEEPVELSTTNVTMDVDTVEDTANATDVDTTRDTVDVMVADTVVNITRDTTDAMLADTPRDAMQERHFAD